MKAKTDEDVYFFTKVSMISAPRCTQLCLVVSLLAMAFSCSRDSTSAHSNVEVLPIYDLLEQKESVLVSSFASSIEYIPLENSEESVFKGYPQVHIVNDSLILVKAFKRISLYSRLTGKYLREIGNTSRDPEGYLTSLGFLGLDSTREFVYAKGWRRELLQYSLWKGKLANKIPRPNWENLSEELVASFGILNDAYVVGFIPNNTGKGKTRLIAYDFNGNLKKIYKNSRTSINNSGGFVMNSREGLFYNLKNDLYFKEYFSDTIFQVTLDTLQARYILDLGKYSPPYEQRQEVLIKSISEYIFMFSIAESEDFLFFRIGFHDRNHSGYFNKKTGTLKIANNKKASWVGFENDLDGFVNFIPQRVSDDHKVIGIIEAEQVYEWFQNNPDKISSLPKHLQALQNIQPEDNPVVMIATLK